MQPGQQQMMPQMYPSQPMQQVPMQQAPTMQQMMPQAPMQPTQQLQPMQTPFPLASEQNATPAQAVAQGVRSIPTVGVKNNSVNSILMVCCVVA